MTSAPTGTAGSPLDLLGRERELAAFTTSLARAAAGSGGPLTLAGPAGSGKSRLLDAMAELARDEGATVLRAAGSEAEADLPWAALGAVCLPLVDRFDRLPGPQGRALRSALALADVEAPIDRLAVSLGALGVLSAAAREAPLVLVVDDVHWIDAESRQALDFIARRIDDDPVVLLRAVRTTVTRPDARTLVLAGLADDELDRLLLAHDVPATDARQAIVALADGNPLLALQLAADLSGPERTGTRPLPANLRVPAEAEDLYRSRLEGLAPEVVQALAVVAADSTGDLGTVAAALGHLGSDLQALEPAELLELVVFDGGRVHVAHPMVRSAAYQFAPPPARRRAHAALARAEGPHRPRGVLHRAAAAAGPDADLAAELAALAWDAFHRGAPATAASRCVRAADLAADDRSRAAVLVDAARAALVAGDPRWAGELLDDARAADPGRVAELDARRIEVRLAAAAGRTDEARRRAEEADAAFGATDPVGVAEVLSEVARPLLPIDPVQAARLAERVWALAGDAPAPTSLYAAVLHGCGRFIAGDAEVAEPNLARWRDLLDHEGPLAAGPFLAETVVLAYAKSYRIPQALAILDELEPPVRAGCAAGGLVSLLAARALVTYGVDLRVSVAAGREALTLARETGQAGLDPVARTALAVAAANVGDEAVLAEVCDQLLATGQLADEVWVRAARGRHHLVQQRPEEAAAQFDLALARLDGPNETFCNFEADAAEAYVRVGRPDDARALLPVLELVAGFGPWGLAMHERVLALLADDVRTADEHFARADEAIGRTDNLIARGVVAFAWGERLRRAKRRAEARRHLERAVELFDRVGATAYRRRAEAELAAAGGTRDVGRPTEEVLSPVELQVARGAAAGSTNRDIAGQLFLSPRTVENHLGAVYRKLGVSGRPGLLARAADDPVLRPPPTA